MTTTLERRQLPLAAMLPHPNNREFSVRGPEWDDFEDDIGARGIVEDMTVRRVEAGSYQILKGHRRHYAGMRRKVEMAWCLVVECDEEAAFDEVTLANMRRENPTPYDEAQAVRVKVDEFHRTVEEIAVAWNRSVEWVRTRQLMLELGDEVLEAVRLPGRDRLAMGSVEEILKCPRDLWGDAVQMVLHWPLEMGALAPEQAREVLKQHLLEPKARERAWDGQREKLGKAVRKDLEKLCLKGTRGELAVQVRSYVEALKLSRTMLPAEDLVDLGEVLPSAPEKLRWVHLAVKHGLAVQVVPAAADHRPAAADASHFRVVVDAMMLRDAEEALAEHGGEAWLATKKRRVEKVESGELRVESEEERRSRDAQALLDGEGERSYQTEDAPEKVIEQSIEHHAYIDMGAVRKVALWAVQDNADPMNAPDFVPKWACKLGVEGLWSEIDAITAWVLGLKKS